jgi:hypothetical protein
MAEEVTVKRGGDYVVQHSVATVGDRTVTNRYTTIQPGISYWSDEDGDWLPSTDQIELLENGAQLSQSPMKVKFAANHNDANGAFEFTLPDGRKIKIQTIGIAFTDQANSDSVWVGELQDCQGFLDPSGNSITYTNAFSGCRADIRVTTGIGRFQADVILREKLLSPESFGFNSATTDLEIWHQVVEAPAPVVHDSFIPRASGRQDKDQQLDFGEMMFAPGTAFLLGPNRVPLASSQGRLAVAKEIFEDAESHVSFLIEHVPFGEASAHIQLLPDRAEARVDRDQIRQRLLKNKSVAEKASRRKPVSVASTLSPISKPKMGAKKVASIVRQTLGEEPGFTMDYTVVKAATNFTFAAWATYHVTNAITLSSTTTIEPGVVVKFNAYTNSAPVINIAGPVVCYTSAYAPAIFTSKDDNSAGDAIFGSTGSPVNCYGWYHLLFTSANTVGLDIHDIHTRYAYIGLGFQGTNSHTLANVQALWCDRAIESCNNTLTIRNLLAQNATNVIVGTNATITAEHVTAHNGSRVFYHSGSTLALKNALVVALSNTSSNVTETSVTTIASDNGVFQTLLAGAHYLPSDSPYHHSGTTSISTNMASILANSTTYTPIQLTTPFTLDTTLSPVVERETGTPDLGYAYPAVDYLWSSLDITNATLLLTNGVCVIGYGPGLVSLQGSSAFVSEGMPHRLNRLLTYNVVQEQPQKKVTNFFNFVTYPAGTTLRFTEASSVLGGYGYLIPNGAFNGSVTLHDSLFHNVSWNAANDDPMAEASPQVESINNIFESCGITLSQGSSEPAYMSGTFRANLFRLGGFSVIHWGTDYGGFYIYDNLFDNCGTSMAEQDFEDPPLYGGWMQANYNGYSGSSQAFVGWNDQLGTISYLSGALGRFYYATNGFLVDAGSDYASNWGLYHHTTATTQVKEGGGVLNIGFHYVAVDANGLPLDYDGDGIPDYLEDRNGNGTADSGESNWAVSNGAGSGAANLIVFTPLQ